MVTYSMDRHAATFASSWQSFGSKQRLQRNRATLGVSGRIIGSYELHCLSASTCRSICTSSPTTRVPSIIWFHVRPKSLRFSVVVASHPDTIVVASLPRPDTIVPCEPAPLPLPVNSTVSPTSLVTPCIVKSPVTSPVFWPVRLTDLLLNVISGNFSTSKKFDDLRSLSRMSLSVFTLAVLIVTSTVDCSGLASSKLI